jgi:hypothetical protein
LHTNPKRERGIQITPSLALRVSVETCEQNRAATHWKGLIVCTCIIAGVEAILAWGVGIDRPWRGDEPHFVKTIVQFGTRPLSLDLLAHYDEMSGPVPFVLYGAWGRLFGFEPQTLRLFSILIAVSTYVLWFWFLQSETGDGRLAAWGTAFVVLHPYMLYLSLFVYTDMLAILCLIGTVIAVRRERPMWLAAALCGAVLNRQYLVFATAATGVYYLARCIRSYWCSESPTTIPGNAPGSRTRQSSDKSRLTEFWRIQLPPEIGAARRRDMAQLLAVAASVVPLAALCVLWKGLCPDGDLKRFYLEKHPTFHVSSLVLYVSLTSIYLTPVLAVRWREFFGCRGPLIVAATLCGLYWLFPASPSPIAFEQCGPQASLGMLHLTLHVLFASEVLEHMAFFIGFAGGVAIVTALALDAWRRLRAGRIDFQLFLDLTAFAFLAVMPCSYLNWEKYFMPLVPVLLLRMLRSTPGYTAHGRG